jgi:hypothetical protein
MLQAVWPPPQLFPLSSHGNRRSHTGRWIMYIGGGIALAILIVVLLIVFL